MLTDPGPWTEDAYLALGETLSRVELVDGTLWVGPAPGQRHQHLTSLRARGLHDAAGQAGLLAFTGVDLRLGNGRILRPDIVIARTDDTGRAVQAAETELVVEVAPPNDLRARLYAAAGIGWYLRVEQPQDSVELRLQKLTGDHYIPYTVVAPGQALSVDEPFPFRLEAASLLRRRRD